MHVLLFRFTEGTLMDYKNTQRDNYWVQEEEMFQGLFAKKA